jgi:SAM-dependent methyltransferase
MDDGKPSYTAEYAPFYEALTGAATRDDVPFYVERASGADGPVLELACGTGRVHLDLLAAGVDADGFDRSAATLRELRRSARERGLDPAVWQADMTAFAVDRAYDLAICPFNAFQHLRSTEEQLSTLRNVHDALAPGGRFVFDVFVPSFDLIRETYGEWQEGIVEYRGDTYETRNRTRIVDEVHQEFAVEMEANEPGGGQAFAIEHRLTMLPRHEVELLARLSPFGDWRVTGDFSGEPLEDGHATQAWTLSK